MSLFGYCVFYLDQFAKWTPPPQLSTFMKPRIRYDSPVDLLLFSSFGSEHSMISRGSVVYQNVDEAHGKFLWENHYKTPKEY